MKRVLHLLRPGRRAPWATAGRPARRRPRCSIRARMSEFGGCSTKSLVRLQRYGEARPAPGRSRARRSGCSRSPTRPSTSRWVRKPRLAALPPYRAENARVSLTVPGGHLVVGAQLGLRLPDPARSAGGPAARPASAATISSVVGSIGEVVPADHQVHRLVGERGQPRMVRRRVAEHGVRSVAFLRFQVHVGVRVLNRLGQSRRRPRRGPAAARRRPGCRSAAVRRCPAGRSAGVPRPRRRSAAGSGSSPGSGPAAAPRRRAPPARRSPSATVCWVPVGTKANRASGMVILSDTSRTASSTMSSRIRSWG